MFVGVEPAQALAEQFAQPIIAVGPEHGGIVDALGPPVETDRMVGASENHASDALAASRLEDVIATDDVGLVDDLPGVLDRHAA